MPPVRFSSRLGAENEEPNALTLATEQRRQSGMDLLDLTLSNPTTCKLGEPLDENNLFSVKDFSLYSPTAQGLLETRVAIASYFTERGNHMDPADLFLTAGTSQAYSFLFKLLCDPGDSILTPIPAYPLLQTLAELEGLEIQAYELTPSLPHLDGTLWRLNRASLESAITSKTRILCVIQPGNPTGSLLDASDWNFLYHFAALHQLSLLVDEVFSEFLHSKASILYPRPSEGPLVFTLNGLSKLLGLPQLKLAWIHVSGDKAWKEKAKVKLEWISDAYLSVSQPMQSVVPSLLQKAAAFQEPIKNRLSCNLELMRSPFFQQGKTIFWPQGGWVIPVLFQIQSQPENKLDDEALAIALVRDEGVLVHPGYYYDFEQENFLVLSLLTEPAILQEGLQRIHKRLGIIHDQP